MRFIILENTMGAQVYLPNRTITNVIKYPRGYLRCLVDVRLHEDKSKADHMEKEVLAIMRRFNDQFPGISVHAPGTEGRFSTGDSVQFLRLKFRLWPGRAGLVETNFRQELTSILTLMEPSFRDWMISVNFEVEKHDS